MPLQMGAGAKTQWFRIGWAAAAAVLGVITLLRVVAATSLGLGDAEAYYWTWSQHLSLGYLDHGPLVAWLIRLGTALGGEHSTLAVRTPFIVLSVATALGCGTLAARLAPRQPAEAAFWAVMGLLTMPAFLVAGGAANPDVPLAGLLLAFTAAMLAAERSARPLRWMALAGTLTGLAISTKLFGLALGVPRLLGAARLRPRLPAVFVGLATALLGAAPFLFWNLQHGWASFRYHLLLRHSQPPGPSLINLGKLIGGQLAYVSPLLLSGLLATGVALWSERRSSSTSRMLLACSLPLLAGGWFLILIVPSAEPHWPLVGYLPLLIALAARLAEAWHGQRLWRGLAVAALSLTGLLGIGLHVHVLTDFGVRIMPTSYVPRFDLSNELRGWPEVVSGIEAQRKPGELVAGCHYTVCSQLAFAAHGAFPVLCPSPRLDQFDFAPGGDGSSQRGIDLVYVLDERFPFAAELLYHCDTVEELIPVKVKRAGRVVREFRLQRCLGFQGLRELRWPPAPHRHDGQRAS